MHQEENRKRRLARFRRADALAPEVERNVTLFGPVFRAPDRPVARLRRPRARSLRLRGERGHEPRPDAEACSLEDGAARKRVIERQRAFGHGVLRVRRERSPPSARLPGRTAFFKPVVGRHPPLSDRQSPPRRPAGGSSTSRPPANPTCRGASPRAPARGLLVVTGHRLETPARGAAATRGLDIGRCNDDMGDAENRVTGRAMEPKPQDRERRVLDALHRAAVFCDQRIRWDRIGVSLRIALITVAAVALYRILRTINPSEVVEALVTTDLRDITLAAVFVAGGYFTLTFYDLFALRTIGRNDVPYWAAALSAFTSYSVGHNVGASVFTGGAVR